MKKLYIFSILFSLVLVSCGGDKGGYTSQPEKTLGDFNLVFPINNELCTEGSSEGPDQISLEFSWTVSENATGYVLAVTDVTANNTQTFDATATAKTVNIKKGTQYSWRVTASLADKKKESLTWSFYSQGNPTESHAPFPADISVTDNGNNTVDVSWTGADLDDDIATFDLLIDGVEILTGTTESQYIGYTVSYGTLFQVQLITKDLAGNSSTAKRDFLFN